MVQGGSEAYLVYDSFEFCKFIQRKVDAVNGFDFDNTAYKTGLRFPFKALKTSLKISGVWKIVFGKT